MENLKEIIELITFVVLGVMGFVAIFLTIERVLFYRGVKVHDYEKKELLEIDLTKNLTMVSSIGSNAPYVGLLGTVLGIMVTFYTIGENGFVDTKVIMVGLALALKATALGLVVAIPSMFFYNLLIRKVDVILTLWEIKD